VDAPAVLLAEVGGAQARLALGEERLIIWKVRKATVGLAVSFGAVPRTAAESGATEMKVSKKFVVCTAVI
jgi:hypothetical protein